MFQFKIPFFVFISKVVDPLATLLATFFSILSSDVFTQRMSVNLFQLIFSMVGYHELPPCNNCM